MDGCLRMNVSRVGYFLGKDLARMDGCWSGDLIFGYNLAKLDGCLSEVSFLGKCKNGWMFECVT